MLRQLVMIFRSCKAASCLYQQVSWGPQLLNQGYGADRMVVESEPKAESPDGLITYSLHMRMLQCLLSSSRRCNASRLLQQWKANNSCGVVRGCLLRILICHLSTGSTVLWCSTLGRGVFSSWHGLFWPPTVGCHTSSALVVARGCWRHACRCRDELTHRKDLLFPVQQCATGHSLFTWLAKHPTCLIFTVPLTGSWN